MFSIQFLLLLSVSICTAQVQSVEDTFDLPSSLKPFLKANASGNLWEASTIERLIFSKNATLSALERNRVRKVLQKSFDEMSSTVKVQTEQKTSSERLMNQESLILFFHEMDRQDNRTLQRQNRTVFAPSEAFLKEAADAVLTHLQPPPPAVVNPASELTTYRTPFLPFWLTNKGSLFPQKLSSPPSPPPVLPVNQTGYNDFWQRTFRTEFRIYPSLCEQTTQKAVETVDRLRNQRWIRRSEYKDWHRRILQTGTFCLKGLTALNEWHLEQCVLPISMDAPSQFAIAEGPKDADLDVLACYLNLKEQKWLFKRLRRFKKTTAVSIDQLFEGRSQGTDLQTSPAAYGLGRLYATVFSMYFNRRARLDNFVSWAVAFVSSIVGGFVVAYWCLPCLAALTTVSILVQVLLLVGGHAIMKVVYPSSIGAQSSLNATVVRDVLTLK